ncbi:MAG: hypothetical protein IKR00_04540 [Lachnospiraceae bacterium]|nr:hypothetical protein [Lachnospiraceae bacterium]
MKVEIVRQFVDKHTGALYKPGMLIDFSENRIIEIQGKNAGLIKVIEEEAELTEEKEAELAEEKVADATEKKKTKSKGKTK